MDHGHYKSESVIDWIGLEIQTAERSNFWTVQGYLRDVLQLPEDSPPGVDSIDATDSGSASIFRFRVQDPNNMHRLNRVLSGLGERFNIKAVRIVGIEIAFDTYSHGASVRELAEIATDRYRFLTAAPGDAWYFYREGGEGRHYINDDNEISHRRDLIKHFAEGWQLTDRNTQDAEIRYHAYVKTRDARRDLLPQAYRARLEVTLQGAALPCTTLKELGQLNFAKLAKHFKFRRLTDDLPLIVRHPLMTWSKQQHGKAGRYRRPNRCQFGRYSGTSVFRGSTVADDELNAVAYECLRKLTRDWRGRRASADFPEGFHRKIPTDTGKL